MGAGAPRGEQTGTMRDSRVRPLVLAREQGNPEVQGLVAWGGRAQQREERSHLTQAIRVTDTLLYVKWSVEGHRQTDGKASTRARKASREAWTR